MLLSLFLFTTSVSLDPDTDALSSCCRLCCWLEPATMPTAVDCWTLGSCCCCSACSCQAGMDGGNTGLENCLLLAPSVVCSQIWRSPKEGIYARCSYRFNSNPLMASRSALKAAISRCSASWRAVLATSSLTRLSSWLMLATLFSTLRLISSISSSGVFRRRLRAVALPAAVPSVSRPNSSGRM